MSLYAQRQRLYTLQQYPRIEGRDGGTCVAQDDGPDAGYECCRTGHVGKDSTVI